MTFYSIFISGNVQNGKGKITEIEYCGNRILQLKKYKVMKSEGGVYFSIVSDTALKILDFGCRVKL